MSKGMQAVLNCFLPFELTNGNDGQGKKWFNSARIRKGFEARLIELGLTREPFESSVVVHVTRVLGKGQRLWDSSSIGRGNWKQIEDSLVAVGWFYDDSPRWITETRFFQDDSRRSLGPIIEVNIFEESNAKTQSNNQQP